MQALDEQGRAIAHGLLRNPNVIAEIASDATMDQVAVAELAGVAWLFAQLVVELELELATAKTNWPHAATSGAGFADEDTDGEQRWSIAKAAASHA